jgi:hypothetical protein
VNDKLTYVAAYILKTGNVLTPQEMDLLLGAGALLRSFICVEDIKAAVVIFPASFAFGQSARRSVENL